MNKTGFVATCVFSVMLSLIPLFTWAGPLDIPDDYREYANNVEFLTHLARRCDIELRILGHKALADGAPCRIFLTRSAEPGKTPAQQERWKSFVRTIFLSANEQAQREWRALSKNVLDNLILCDKTLDHIKFVNR